MTTITITEQDVRLIRQAQAKGQSLFAGGAVELVDAGALVEDEGGIAYFADATRCDCSTADERGGHACSHMWSWRYAADHAEAQETAA